jgi:hypothetical protein
VANGTRGPREFELIERISREALASHPAWMHYDEKVDAERIQAWGVSRDHLASLTKPFESCGLIPLYPVLDLESLDKEDRVMLAAHFGNGAGLEFDGYLLEPLAFGLFHESEEYSFNRSLPGFSAREARRLATAAGVGEDELLPFRFELDPRLATPGEAGHGEIDRYW